MSTRQLTDEMQGELCQLLASHHVTMRQPRQRMLQLDSVPVGASFSSLCTNVLLREYPSKHNWHVFVDEGLMYQGDDPDRKSVFQGDCRRGWQQLAVRPPLTGNVNQAFLQTLDWLDSDLRHQVRQVLKEDHLSPFDKDGIGNSWRAIRDGELQLDGRLGRRLNPATLIGEDMTPTSSQLDWVANAASTVCRKMTPSCPLVVGPAGAGKSTVAKLVARELTQRGIVDQVFELRGSEVCAGAVFLADRDERLRHALESLVDAERTLVILEEFDLAVAESPAAISLLAGGLDRGLNLVAVGRAEFKPRQLGKCTTLRRRLEPLIVRPMTQEDTVQTLHWWLRRHPSCGEIETSNNVVPLILELAARRPGANPGAALGLLEAVISRAVFAGRRCIGPDDVFHLCPRIMDA